MSKLLLKAFIDENYSVLKIYLRRRFNQLNEYDAEDIVQQTIIKLLYRGRDDLSVRNVSSYIYTSLQNGAKDYFKKSHRIELREDDVEIPTHSVEDEMLRMELAEQIRKAIMSLDEKSKYIFIETEIKGRSYEEIAAETGEKLGTLLSRKSRAKSKLRAALREYTEVDYDYEQL